MAYTAPAHIGPGSARPAVDINAGAYHAYQILHFGFTILPIIAGIDKFFNYLTNWEQYLAPSITKALGMPAHSIMVVIGCVEIVAGLIVAFVPRIGAYIVALWLIGIIGNLAINPTHYWDVAARDFGLCLGAFALGSISAWVNRMRTGATP